MVIQYLVLLVALSFLVAIYDRDNMSMILEGLYKDPGAIFLCV